MGMISAFFTILSILIWARIIFSFLGYNYGPVYDFVYTYSEKLLAPVRKRLPRSNIDWSPFVVLIFLQIFSEITGPIIFYIVNGQWSNLGTLLLSVLFSLIQSVLTFLLIMVIVKIINDHVNGQYYTLTYFLNSLTAPVLRRIANTLPYEYRKFSIWLLLMLIIILKILLKKILESILFGI